MPITSPCDSVSVSGAKVPKMGLNRQPNAHTAWGGGRGWFSPTPNHVIRKQTVNATLAMGHQADLAHC
jgi:hypothetical protein